ncbi:MAG: hypothetical protein LUE11_07395 [Clostridia bacterium]|nr:hypothetical protein [Clostridia bacterium]
MEQLLYLELYVKLENGNTAGRIFSIGKPVMAEKRADEQEECVQYREECWLYTI